MPVYIRYEDFEKKSSAEFRNQVNSTKIEISKCENVLTRCDLSECTRVEKLSLKKNNQKPESSSLAITKPLPSKINSLKIIDSKLISLSHNAFENCCSNITYLDLSGNLLTQLSQTIFNNCDNLVFISLANNCLKALPNEIFNDCKKLKTLNLASNRLHHLDKEIFISCTKLRRIDLSKNLFSNLNDLVQNNLDEGIFRNCLKLERIDLSNNHNSNLEIRRENVLVFKVPGTQLYLIFPNLVLYNYNDHLLHWSMKEEKYDIVIKFLTEIKIDLNPNPDLEKFLNETNQNGETILHLAAKQDYINKQKANKYGDIIKIFRLLIDVNLELNALDSNGNGNSFLHYLIEKKETDALEIVLSHLKKTSKLDNIDLNLENPQNGKSPLNLACSLCVERAVYLLCSFGCFMDKSALEYVISSKCTPEAKNKTIKTLIKMGIDFTHLLDKDPKLLKEIRMNYTIRNLIFEGGGVKGIAYVSALEKAIIKENETSGLFKMSEIKNIGGTSAGAITAVLLALDYSIKEIENILKEMDLTSFLDSEHKKNFLEIRNKITNNHMSFSTMMKHLLFDNVKGMAKEINQYNGLFPGETFRDWIHGLILKKMGSINATFQDLNEKIEAGNSKFKHLYLTGSNLTTGECETFSHLDTPDLIIADAVRISMSIPLVWRPHKYYIRDEENGKIVRPDKQNYDYVDGGLLNNYPISLFDKKISKNGKYDYVNKETLGFKLSTKKEPKDLEIERSDGFFGYFFSIVNFYYNREEINLANRVNDQLRSIYIDTFDLSALKFDLGEDLMKKLIESGKKAVDEYTIQKQNTQLNISAYLYGHLIKRLFKSSEINDLKLKQTLPVVFKEIYSNGFYEYLTEDDVKLLGSVDQKNNNAFHLAAEANDLSFFNNLFKDTKITSEVIKLNGKMAKNNNNKTAIEIAGPEMIKLLETPN